MRVEPATPIVNLRDRRNRSAERRTAPNATEARKNGRRDTITKSAWVAAPFGAHLLGQLTPSPVNKRSAAKAYAKGYQSTHARPAQQSHTEKRA